MIDASEVAKSIENVISTINGITNCHVPVRERSRNDAKLAHETMDYKWHFKIN